MKNLVMSPRWGATPGPTVWRIFSCKMTLTLYRVSKLIVCHTKCQMFFLVTIKHENEINVLNVSSSQPSK